MPVVSVTRLHLRSLRFLPAFVWSSFRSRQQLRRAGGFRGGWLSNETVRAYWTATTWDSPEAMRAYRNSPPHAGAMKNLLRWCDSASYVHWEQAGDQIPYGETAHRRMRIDGHLSKVRHPSETHLKGETVGTNPPRPGNIVRPRP
jgi:heme-degrading monooxygenase HmoA